MDTKEEFNHAFRYSLSLTKNEEDAFDLLQSGFEKFIKHDGFNTKNPRAYLFRIIRNQLIDDKRKNIRWQFEEFSEEKNKIALLNINGLDDLWIEAEEIGQIYELLSAPERELIYLWAVEEYTVQEISDLMNVPRGTLLSKLHRLKKKLRNQMGDQGKEVGYEKTN